MGRLSEKQLLIMTVAVVLLSVLVIGGLVARYRGMFFAAEVNVDSLEKEITGLNKQVKENGDKIAQIKALTDKLEQTKAENLRTADLLPDEKDLDDERFLNDAQSWAEKAGVKITSVKQTATTRGGSASKGKGKKAKKSSFGTTDWQLVVGGAFSQILEFIHLAEKYRQFIRVTEFGFRGTASTGRGKANLKPTYVVTVKMTSFHFAGSLDEPEKKKEK